MTKRDVVEADERRRLDEERLPARRGDAPERKDDPLVRRDAPSLSDASHPRPGDGVGRQRPEHPGPAARF